MVKNNIDYYCVDLQYYLSKGEAGKIILDKIISSFSCAKNVNIETFLKDESIKYYRKKWAITYLVLSKKSSELVGYFTLSLSTTMFNKNIVGREKRKLYFRNGLYDDASKQYIAPLFLIGQFGKNISSDTSSCISGTDLMKIVLDKLYDIQSMIGGSIVYLECEENKKLIHFYEKNGFTQFGSRISNGGHNLIQVYTILK